MKEESIEETIHIQIRALANKTIEYFVESNLDKAKQYIFKAEYIYENSNDRVKNIVADTFVLPVSSYMELTDRKLLSLLPLTLKTEYLKMIHTTSK
jgi:hypothetical protein